ncbi:MAG TPA: 50S ribosomal protein L11 methyltransferase, partial [Anaerolineae bacterium]|nr:50S ribosomal protein L11 methyltransferase [Anaerolineae bacterium]
GGAVVLTEFNEEFGEVGGVVTVRTYLPISREGLETRRRLEEGLWHLSQIYPLPPPRFRQLTEEDWASAWKKHYRVLRAGRRLVIKPSWQEYTPRPEDVVIELDPGMAFGTGVHPTTRMCLAALEDHLRPGMRVLDLGTGSGILAIAAAKLGAGSVLALDVDPVAVRVARDNVLTNGVEGIVAVRQGSLAEARGRFDLVLANILARVIVELAERGLADRLRMGGLLVAAGIIEDQEEGVRRALQARGMAVVERRRERDWVTLIAARRPGF